MQKKILFLVSVAILGLIYALSIFADMIPSSTVSICFEKDGKPYEKPVDFKITCYGYDYWRSEKDPKKEEGTYAPEEIFSFSEYCHKYCCTFIDEFYFRSKVHSDYCNLEGETEGSKFKIEKFSDVPFEVSWEGQRYDHSGRAYDLHLTIPSDSDLSESELIPQKRGFWASIWCFLKDLFGRGCD